MHCLQKLHKKTQYLHPPKIAASTQTSSAPVNMPKVIGVGQIFPVGVTVTLTDEAVAAHAWLATEKIGARLLLLGTLQATCQSEVGFDSATKLQDWPLLQGRGPLTADMVPFNIYLQLGTAAEHSANRETHGQGHLVRSLTCNEVLTLDKVAGVGWLYANILTSDIMIKLFLVG
jgi:hypothetical protein